MRRAAGVRKLILLYCGEVVFSSNVAGLDEIPYDW